MTWYYEGREIEEEGIDAIVMENYDLDDFEEELNEMYSPVSIYENFYEQGTALRRVDETTFKDSYVAECRYRADEIRYRKDDTDRYDFGIQWIDDEVVE